MKQHLKIKVLDGKALRLPPSSCQQQILYLYDIPPYKRSYKKEVIILNDIIVNPTYVQHTYIHTHIKQKQNQNVTLILAKLDVCC